MTTAEVFLVIAAGLFGLGTGAALTALTIFWRFDVFYREPGPQELQTAPSAAKDLALEPGPQERSNDG